MPFAEIIGQDRAVDALRAAVRRGALHHAYLLAGPEGVGKGMVARLLAQAANCEREDGDACGVCPSCRKIARGVHPDVLVALGRTQTPEPNGALGILESFSIASLIQAADAAAKAAAVQLLEIRLAMALGGKAFVTMTGDVGSVQAAVAAGRAVIAEAGMLVNAVVISRPHPDVYKEMI